MDNWREQHYMGIIKEKANEIREKIRGGRIFGIEIDPDNPDMVILAAYLYGSTNLIKYDPPEESNDA